MAATGTELRTAWRAMSGPPLRIFLICLFGLTLANTDQSLFGYAIPGLLAEFDLGLEAVGWILSVSFIVAALCNLGIGVAADRLGRRRLFIACLALSAGLVALLCFAPDVITLTVLRALGFGLSAALVPLATTYTVEAAPDRLRGLASGLLQLGYPLGWFIASLIAAPILAAYSWRYIFLPAAIVIPIAFWFARALPESQRFLDQRRQAAAERPRDWLHELKLLFQPPLQRRAVLCALMFFFHAGAYAGTAFYFPTFFVEVHGYTEQEAAALVGLSYGIGAIGYVTAALVGEFLLTRRDTIALWVSLGAFTFLALVWLPDSRLENLIWFGLMTMFFYGCAAVQWAFAAEQFPTRARATATAMIMAATLAGFALFPVLVAYVIEILDWRWSFTGGVFPALVLSVMATLGLERIPSGAALDEIAEV
jgi:MFS family permease